MTPVPSTFNGRGAVPHIYNCYTYTHLAIAIPHVVGVRDFDDRPVHSLDHSSCFTYSDIVFAVCIKCHSGTESHCVTIISERFVN